jgi:hypothetical protein
MSREIFKESREELYSSAANPPTSRLPQPAPKRKSVVEPRETVAETFEAQQAFECTAAQPPRQPSKRKSVVEQPDSPRKTAAETLEERRKTLKDRREELNSGVTTSPMPARTESPSRLPRPPPRRKSIIEKFGSPRHAVQRTAYTVDEFCWAHGFSRAQYYKLKARGEGPDEFRVGKRVLISEEAAARWRRKRTQEAAQQSVQQLAEQP